MDTGYFVNVHAFDSVTEDTFVFNITMYIGDYPLRKLPFPEVLPKKKIIFEAQIVLYNTTTTTFIFVSREHKVQLYHLMKFIVDFHIHLDKIMNRKIVMLRRLSRIFLCSCFANHQKDQKSFTRDGCEHKLYTRCVVKTSTENEYLAIFIDTKLLRRKEL